VVVLERIPLGAGCDLLAGSDWDYNLVFVEDCSETCAITLTHLCEALSDVVLALGFNAVDELLSVRWVA
jgi:hypothetical protein